MFYRKEMQFQKIPLEGMQTQKTPLDKGMQIQKKSHGQHFLRFSVNQKYGASFFFFVQRMEPLYFAILKLFWMGTSSWYDFVICVQQTDSQSKKAFGKELEDLGCERRKHKAGRKPVTRLSNGWRLLPDVGKAEHSAKQFDSGLKESKGNKKSKEPYGKKRPMESSTYSLIDDDDDDDDDDDNDTSGHETPRFVSNCFCY